MTSRAAASTSRPPAPAVTASQAGELGLAHEVVGLERLVGEVPGGQRARAVRAVPVQLRAPVDHHELVGADLARRAAARAAARRGGRRRRSSQNDGLLGAEVLHRALQRDGHADLGAPGQPLLHDLAQGGVGELGRLADPRDLVGVLDRAQRLDGVPGGDQLDALGGQLRAGGRASRTVIWASSKASRSSPGGQHVRDGLQQLLRRSGGQRRRRPRRPTARGSGSR